MSISINGHLTPSLVISSSYHPISPRKKNVTNFFTCFFLLFVCLSFLYLLFCWSRGSLTKMMRMKMRWPILIVNYQVNGDCLHLLTGWLSSIDCWLWGQNWKHFHHHHHVNNCQYEYLMNFFFQEKKNFKQIKFQTFKVIKLFPIDCPVNIIYSK